jgi:hydroxypyruvate reductase
MTAVTPGKNEWRAAPREALRALFDAAVASVSAEGAMPKQFDLPGPGGRMLLVAIGKGAAAMAASAVKRLPSSVTGIVVTRAGHGVEAHRLPPGIEVIEAGHPIPDGESMLAAERVLALATELGPKDRLLMLVSGGGSALLALPAAGVTLKDKQTVTQALLRSGATIAEINCVRKHLSRIKGGRLAVAAAPARVTTLIISDVPGDDPSFIASGPTVADSTTLADAREIVARYRIPCPDSVTVALAQAANETPPADTLGLAGADVRIIACARDALAAAAKLADLWGYRVTDLGDHLQAEARHLGAGHAGLARRLAGEGLPRIILSGGETTVTVSNPKGRGGRNLEYLLGLAIALDGLPGVWAIAGDTDGIDGTEANAGAVVTPDTLARARALGLDPAAALKANETYRFFEALGDLVVTGPTRTNVNDFRAILIEPKAG